MAPRGRPPTGTTWDEKKEEYVTADGKTYVKAPVAVKEKSDRPAGRPKAGMMWDAKSKSYVADPNAKKRKASEPAASPKKSNKK
jgi:hypothetical protein